MLKLFFDKGQESMELALKRNNIMPKENISKMLTIV